MLSQMTQFGGKMEGMEPMSIRRFAHVSDINQFTPSQAQNDRVVRLARLAMLIECEGSITIGMAPPSKTRNRPSLYPAVTITNTAEKITDEARDTLITESIGFTLREQRYASGRGKKLRNDIALHGFVRVSAVLKAVLPYLRSKKKQAEIVIAFIHSRQNGEAKSAYTDRDWWLTTEVRKLNRTQPQRKALAKAQAYLESPEGSQRPRTTEYFRKYVEMCTELQRGLAAQ
jgi:hypothetical protein